jgi:hypothetical protein
VVFLNNLTSFEDQLNRRGEFIKEIKKQLYEVQHERRFRVKFEVQSSWWPNARSLSFKLSAPHLHQEVEFDVLPAFDVLGKPACQRASAHLSACLHPPFQFHLCVCVCAHVCCIGVHMYVGVILSHG